MNKVFLTLKRNKFLSNSILYIIGSMMTPAIGFIMLPIYTSYLSTDEYGIMTTVNTLAGMFQLFFLLSLHGAVTRFFYDYIDNKKEQQKYLGSIFTFVFIFSTALSVLQILMHNPIGKILFSEIPIKPYYFYLIGLAWTSALFALPLSLWRAQEKAGIFILFNIIKSILIMLFSSYLIIVKGLGVEGALSANLIISLLFVLISFILTKKSYTINLDIEYIKKSLQFSLPLLPHVASGWIIKSSDRVILEKSINLGELGLYSLAAQVAMVLSLFYTGINNALVPRYTILRKQGNLVKARKLLMIFKIIIFITGIMSVPVAVFTVKMLTTVEFSGAIKYIPILIIGEMIKGLYFIPVANLFYTKSTNAIATSSVVAALINIVFNLMLIPFIGAYGAAISTIIAEITRFLLIYRVSKRSNNKLN